MSIKDVIHTADVYTLRSIEKCFYLDPEKYVDEIDLIEARHTILREEQRIRREAFVEEQAIRQREQEAIRVQVQIAKDKERESWLKDPLNQATKAGWEALRLSSPNHDGVERFEDLPEALLYRYGAFARAVLGFEQDPIIKSKKQLMREEKEQYNVNGQSSMEYAT